MRQTHFSYRRGCRSYGEVPPTTFELSLLSADGAFRVMQAEDTELEENA